MILRVEKKKKKMRTSSLDRSMPGRSKKKGRGLVSIVLKDTKNYGRKKKKSIKNKR